MSAEKLYKEIKSGRVKLSQLNDEGKAALKQYMSDVQDYRTSPSQMGQAQSQAKQAVSEMKRDLAKMTVGSPPVAIPEPEREVTLRARDGSEQPLPAAMQVEARKLDKQYEPLPGRELPLIGGALQTLDQFAGSKPQKLIADIGQAVYTPGATVPAVMGFMGVVGNAATKAIPKLSQGVGGKIATEAIKEGAVGAPIGFMQSLAQDNDLGTAAKHAALGAATGAVGGAAITGAGPLLRKGADTVQKAAKSSDNQGWFEKLFGNQGVGIAAGSGRTKELIDTHIVSHSKKPNSVVSQIGDKVSTANQNLVDKFAPFKLIDDDTYSTAMDSTRANNLANVTIRDKFVDLEGNVRGKSLKEVYQTVPRGEKDLADRYIIMRDAVNRMDRGLKVYGDEPWFPKTADEADRMVKELEAKNPWLQQFGSDWNEFNRNRQDLWVESGIASQELIDTLRHTNPNYAQMFRQQDATGLKGKLGINTSKSGFSGQKAPIKRAVGSSKKIIEPAQGMIETTGSSYNAMMRNRAMQNIHNAVKADPDKYKGIIEIVDETADMKQSTMNRINEALAENGPEGIADMLNDEINGIFKKSQQSAKGETVTVMIQGQPVKMQVSDPSLLKAIEGISPEQLGAITNVFNTISRGIKYAATGGLAPLQGLKLAFRDLPIAYAQSKNKLRFPLDISHALVSQIGDWLPGFIPGSQKLGNLARQYYRAGGGYEAYLKGDSKIRSVSADLTKDPILSGRNLVKTVRKLNPFRPLKAFGDALENIPRIAAFSQEMRKNGWKRSPEIVRAAVEEGREATVNWSRRGAKGAEIEAYLPYSNAAVQGTYRLMKRFKEQPMSAIALIMGIAGAKIASYEQFKDDPDYQQRSKFEKGIPYAKTEDGKFLTTPVEPTEAFIADQILNFYKWAKDQEELPDVKETIQEGAEAFLPKYASGPVAGATTPGKSVDLKSALSTTVGGSAFEPIMAGVVGKNFFGGDVVPREYQGLPTDLQYNETTSVAGKWAAENLGIDAFTFDYLGQKFGGDLAKIGLPMTSDVGRGDPTGNILDETLTRIKLLEDPVMKNRISNDYYGYADSVSQAKESFSRKDVPLPEWYQSAYDEVTSTKKDSLSTRISELNKMKKEIQRDTMIGAKDRADQLREVQSQINLLRIQGIKRLEELGVPKSKGN